MSIGSFDIILTLLKSFEVTLEIYGNVRLSVSENCSCWQQCDQNTLFNVENNKRNYERAVFQNDSTLVLSCPVVCGSPGTLPG